MSARTRTASRWSLSLLGLTVAAVGFSAEATPVTPESLSKELDAIVQKGIDEKAYPGAVLIVGKPGRTLHAKAYGALTYDAGATSMTLDTLFDLASVSKVVGTATAAMKLWEQKKVALDDKVTKYIPEFAAGGKQDVTVRDLMTHVSGLKSYEAFANAEKARKPGQSTADAMILRIAALPSSNPRGTTVTYSCLNMQTQARINEVALQGRMDDFLRKTVYGPLGMNNTTYRPDEKMKGRVAPTSRKGDGGTNSGQIHDPLANYHSAEEHCPGNAGVFSTAPDLARYCEMILREGKGRNGKRVFKPATIRLMTSLQTPEGISNFRGLGWDIQRKLPYCTELNQTDATRVISHTGYTGTMIWLDKRTKTFFVFLTNRTWPDDSGKSSRGVSAARAGIASTILRLYPEYRKVMADAGTPAR